MTKLVLGSAAWRSRYGAYSKGLLSDNQIKDLTSRATALGFDFIDTAPSYGDTEEAIGRIKPMQSLATKVTVDSSDYSSIIKSIDRSRKNLGVESLDLLFIHNWDVLTESEKGNSVDVLQACTSNQSIKSWGFSTYDAFELTKIVKYGWSNSRVQINTNILDQRILKMATYLRSADFKALDCEIWVRSVFLQGVLLNESLKNPFLNHQDIIKFFSFCKQSEFSPIEICLAYIRQLDFVDRIVLGIENELQLIEISQAFQIEIPHSNFDFMESDDLELIDPRKWKKSK